MATITLNATANQSARIQEAVAAYNAANRTTLTVKQWIYTVLRQAVASELGLQQEAAARAAQEAAAQAMVTTVAADMAGGS